MVPYKNLHGNSNIVAYELGVDSITVQFMTGTHKNYLYDSFKPGADVVSKMKELAIQGYGLNSYISRIVKSNFAKKW